MTQKSYVIIMAEEELSTIFLPKSNNLGNLRLNKDDKRTSSALLPPERHSSVLRGTVLAHDPSHGGKWACEWVPSILSLQVTAKDSHFFVAPSQNLRCAAQQKDREQQVEPSEGIQGTHILVTVSQTPSGGLRMSHWRHFTFKSPQLPHVTPRSPHASPLPQDWLPISAPSSGKNELLQLVSKHTNF